MKHQCAIELRKTVKIIQKWISRHSFLVEYFQIQGGSAGYSRKLTEIYWYNSRDTLAEVKKKKIYIQILQKFTKTLLK